MLFIPKNSKYKKQQKGRAFNKLNSLTHLYKLKGSVGLKALSFCRLTSKQLNSIHQSINKIVKKLGRIQMNVFPQTPISKKPKEIRMGKGKGSVDHWVSKVKPGTILCEIKTDFIPIGIKALKTAQIRLPVKTKIIFN